VDRRETYLIVLRSELSNIPAVIRLRQVLKSLLRTHGFRCTKVEEITENLTDDTPPEPPPLGRKLAGGLGRAGSGGSGC
jgi:hypothetical protein